MTFHTHFIEYPEGDTQEIESPLRVGQIVDINGVPLSFPLRSAKIIAYRVYKMSTKIFVGEEAKVYSLELVPPAELISES